MAYKCTHSAAVQRRSLNCSVVLFRFLDSCNAARTELHVWLVDPSKTSFPAGCGCRWIYGSDRPGTCEQTLSSAIKRTSVNCVRIILECHLLRRPCAEACESKSRYRPAFRFNQGHLAAPSALVGVSSFDCSISSLHNVRASYDHDQDTLSSAFFRTHALPF
ncbi:hypothetical protein SCHPADRAFT_149240 [Schizopora paradoxa]|uniref:Uncharacterized protein n=1 Tax=Schizopora paradoxa TaxID=27342 RepID=A0A0H2S083_9AGAM|nr:hypothetical protein SCHPADRAFT_149240 [Schizopora paradoxa]